MPGGAMYVAVLAISIPHMFAVLFILNPSLLVICIYANATFTCVTMVSSVPMSCIYPYPDADIVTALLLLVTISHLR